MNILYDYTDRKLSTDEYTAARNHQIAAIKELEDVEFEKGSDYLLLKWGSWKDWQIASPKAQELMKRHNELGESLSAIMQHESDEQKEILCQVIDEVDGVIQNDWDGDYYTKQQAKDYIMGYGS